MPDPVMPDPVMPDPVMLTSTTMLTVSTPVLPRRRLLSKRLCGCLSLRRLQRSHSVALRSVTPDPLR
jgi:hypothetical protein